MDISIYFEPVQLQEELQFTQQRRKRIGDLVNVYQQPGNFPDLDGMDIALIGVLDDRNAVENKGCGSGPDHVRSAFYHLFPSNGRLNIADLGNILPGNTVNDTYFALSAVMAEVMAMNIIPIVIGGGQDLTWGMYRGYEKIGRIINLACVDPMFDLGESEGELNSLSYLSRIIMHQPSYLFNYTNIGFQSYLVDTQSLSLMRNLFFDAYRLGLVQADMEGAEPLVRNADMISIDIGAVRASDAPGNANAQPNGLYGEELCRITRYAGLSEKVSSLGFFEYNPEHDIRNQTARLIAEAIWYFVDGFYGRQQDYPREGSRDYVKFNVTMKEIEEELTFFKSKKSDRWWMKVPFKTRNLAKYERHHMVPCSYSDYETAMKNNLPDRWWLTYQKLM